MSRPDYLRYSRLPYSKINVAYNMNKCNKSSGLLILKHYCTKPSFNLIIYSNEKFLSVGLLSADSYELLSEDYKNVTSGDYV